MIVDVPEGILMLEAIIITFLDLYAWAPMFGTVLFRKINFFHTDVISDIPGNIHAFDTSIISLFRTLPEPSNFNLVWTSLPLNEPLLIRGELPNSRLSSLSIYGQGKKEPPNSIDLQDCVELFGDNRKFEVIISALQHQASVKCEKTQSFLSCNDWARGMLAMRNYLVSPGDLVHTPEIVKLSDGSIIRPSTQLITGPTALAVERFSCLKRVVKFVAVNALFVSCNIVFLPQCCWTTSVCLVLVSAVLACSLYFLCYFIGARGLNRFCSEICAEKNKMYLASLEQGSKTSQPSRLHKYWIMVYDIPEGKELSVTGRIRRTDQKYWSLVAYDPFGLCLPQYVHDATATEVPIPGDNDTQNCYSYDIRLVHRARGARSSPHKRPGLTDVDVSSHPKGYVLFRLVHPVSDEVSFYSAPTATVVGNAAVQNEYKKQK